MRSRVLAAAAVTAAVLTPATTATAGGAWNLTPQAATTCVHHLPIYNLGTRLYLLANPNGTLAADGDVNATSNPYAQYTFCNTDGKIAIQNEGTHGWIQDLTWANNVVMAHIPAYNPADLTQQFLTPCDGTSGMAIRSRGNALYWTPTTPGNLVYSQAGLTGIYAAYAHWDVIGSGVPWLGCPVKGVTIAGPK